MVGHSSLFSQLLLLVNRHQFARRVKECCAEKAAKGFSCWSQFVAMMFCQLAQAKSLREISDGLACCEGKLNHLGAVKLHLLLDHDGYLPVFAHLTEGRVHEMIVAKSLNFSKGTVVVMDRGYIDYKLFARWTKAGIFFVTRLKENANYWHFEDRPVPKSSNVLKDQLIRLNPITVGAPCREDLRLVTVWDERNQCEVKLLTNQLEFAAKTIADIYRERWQIELLFKALKQNLKIKTFVGTSANAVRIQIWTALIAILLLKILQFKSTFGWALSNLVAFTWAGTRPAPSGPRLNYVQRLRQTPTP